MQFQHPEFLYLLFLLIIPILVHLFQLRRFQKTPFTNVAFLKKVTLQTRKSAKLKKWLILLTRLLALTCIILAFAQPFIPNETASAKAKETILYLDNSFSMQLEGQRGELLKRAVQEILESLPSEKKITFVTNEQVYKNTKVGKLKKELVELDYAPISPSINTIFLRAKSEFSKDRTIQKEFIAISDFQENSVETDGLSSKNIHLGFIQLSPVNTNNIAIDSLYISSKSIEKATLTALISYTGKASEMVPVSLFSNKKLLAVTSADFEKKQLTKVNFTLNNTRSFQGKITVEDQGLQYDNAFYFSIHQPEKIKVVALGEAKDNFLKRIYHSTTFDFSSFQKGEFDYNQISTANTIILNGLKEIPSTLLPILSQVINNGGHLVVIPSKEIDLESYNRLFLRLGGPRFSKLVEEEKTITEIVFAHPLYENVFDDKVDNFQYPKVQTFFPLQGNTQSILQFADKSPFLIQNENLYVFTASLDTENSNFKNSPLIVPTFYNIGKQSLKSSKLYYTLGKKAVFEVKAKLQKDEILRIENENFSFIPKQQIQDDRVQLTTESLPKKAGIFKITKDGKLVQKVAFNYDRQESKLTYANLAQLDQAILNTDVGDFFNQQKEQNQIVQLWKWFVIFAVFFLLIELLLLNYLK